MTIRYLDRNFTSFQDYINRSASGRSLSADITAQYAYPIDGWIISTLNATPVKAILDKALDVVVSYQFGHELAESVPIDQKSFPDLFDVLCHCANTLGIPIPYVVVSPAGGAVLNAFTAGTDESAFISVTSTLCKVLTKEEASFVIGHECGHIAAGHMVYHTLAQVLTGALTTNLGIVGEALRATASIPLLAWSRRSEATGDRAGLLCCGDIKVAERALLHLVVGWADIDRVEIEDYLSRVRSVEEFHWLAKFHQYFDSHPLIPKRIEALRLFADSEVYYALSGKPRPVGKVLLSREDLNHRVSQIIRP